MSKQLDSILDSATEATPPVARKKTVDETVPRKRKTSLVKKKTDIPDEPEPDVNLTITLPKSVKRAMFLRMAEDENGEETYRTLILKGLKSIGIDVSEDMLVDRRRTR